MFKLPQHATKTLLAVHGWSGVLLGVLLYAVICTGVAAVFASEINHWASPLNRGDVSALPRNLDATVRQLATHVDPAFHEEVAAYRSGGGRLLVFFHKHESGPDGKPTERGVEFELNPETQQVLATREGWYEEIEEQRRADGVAAFLVDLHVRLHIPDPYGLIVTGVLGMVMMIAAVTGLIIHRHLIKELFTVRRRGEAVLQRRDLHVIAGSWNLPFAFLLAFTGSFFSFASTIGLPLVANAAFDGDQEALIETLYGAPNQEDATPASMGNLDAMIADGARRSEVEPYFIGIERYGRADSKLWVYTPLPENRMVYSSHLYNAATGEHLSERPPLGNSPSFGASLVGLMYPLHFGNFAGVISKAVWFALGFAGAYVTLSGMVLWTRRRIEQPVWRSMSSFVHYVGYGLPLALVIAPYAHFAFAGSETPTGTLQGIAFLLVAFIAAITTVTIQDVERLRRGLLAATAVGLLGLPLMRMTSGGPGWVDAWQADLPAIVGVDLTLILSGAVALWFALARQRERAGQQILAAQKAHSA